MNIYISDFASDITEDDLLETFGAFGHVAFVQIIKGRLTASAQRFGFVEMPVRSEAQNALRRVTKIKDGHITVIEAKPNVNYASQVG